jgi:Fic family protein
MATNRGEDIAMMEPLVLGDRAPRRGELADLALDLAQKSASLKRSIPESMLPSLAGLVRSMNCYYSNLIEGHDTHPIDIERALNNDFTRDTKKRDLQLEAKAHIAVQEWIDAGGLHGDLFSSDALCSIHRRFYENVPDSLHWVTNPETDKKLRVVGGALRDVNVAVGRHIAISPEALPRFLARYAEVFSKLGKVEVIMAAAAAHHRMAWIHPFADGNGRVMRLQSHALFLHTLDTGAVWSVARGLARSVQAYKSHLASCDLPRRNDLDGRGNLSEEALSAFTEYFLQTCIDQVSFMESLIQPDRLRARIQLWAEEEMRVGTLPAKSGLVLDAILYRGELPRSEIAELVGTGDRQARRIVAELAKHNVIAAESIRAPIRLAFPATLAHRWMPGLFPEKAG